MFDIFDFFKNIIERIKYLECCDDINVYPETFYNSMPPRTCYTAFTQK